jgi:hypothetical protein
MRKRSSCESSTPWLTTRRRTCPICKGDVVRSMARHSRHVRSPSPREGSIARRRGERSRHRRQTRSDGDVPTSLLSEEDVQVQAATLRNDSPSAAIPIPTAEVSRSDTASDEDMERGIDVSSAPEARPRTHGTSVWRRVGSLGLPGFLSRGRSPNEQEDRRTR